MISLGLGRWPLGRGALLAALVIIIIGVLHRRATVDAWVDDRSLATEPSWFQLAAPLWHTSLDQSATISHALTRVIDPLTASSTAGDSRALAAILIALSAGALLIGLRRAAVPDAIAFLMCAAIAGSVLPVAPATIVTHALQVLVGTALIVTCSTSSATLDRRLLLMGSLTLIGVLNHASFLAFATGVWGVEWLYAERGIRVRVLAAGAVTLAGGVLLVAGLLQGSGTPSGMPIDRPGTLAMIRGLLTGRFANELQPSHDFDLLSTLALSVPGPAIVCAPLAALAFARPDTRRLAVTCASAFGFLVLFVAGSWLPDPHVASAPARLAVAVLVGVGLSWVAAQPGRSATSLAVMASALIGLRGFVEPTHWSVPVETAQLRAFVEAMPEALGQAAWTADRLAASRALLAAHPDLAASRMPMRSGLLSAVPEERPVVVLGGRDARVGGDLAWTIPFDVSYPSAARFLAAQPAHMWMAVAIRGQITSGFCGDLLERLGAPAREPAGANVTLLARMRREKPPWLITGSDRLDIEYGRTLDPADDPVPARFRIEADPSVRIIVNSRAAARADDGMAIVTFDSWSFETHAWLLPSCDASAGPPIRDARLGAAYLLEPATGRPVPEMPPVASGPVHVRLGEDAADWFGEGWHRSEGLTEHAFRWTSARDAYVNVIVARRQALRVRMNGALAEEGPMSNAMGLSWNGEVIRPLGAWTDGVDAEWIVPEALVRRGLNVFTIHVGAVVSPASTGSSPDTRPLGAVIRHLSFEPVARSR